MPVVPVPNYAFKNNGDITFSSVAKDWGLSIPSMSNGAAYGDLDNDGDLDLVVNNVNMQAFLYRNTAETTNNNHIKLKLEGNPVNPFAVGSTVWLYYKNNIVFQELIPTRGFQSSMDYVMTIGLGATKTIDSIRIVWPDDTTQKMTNVAANSALTLKQSDATEKYRIPKKEDNKTIFKELANTKLASQ